MYEVYAHKQAPRNMTESPQSNLGFSSNANLNEGITNKAIAGIGIAAARVIPAGKQVIQTFVDASGNKRIKKTVNRINTGIGFGATALTLGLPTAIGIETIKFGVDLVANDVQGEIDQTNQNYDVQKRGVAVNKFTGVGERID